ncbi:hypothetical protein EDB86DRAFT_2823978 [Lactarius hatsudake]|nr:hypothetical protein EDB86DRAFT_2823978 [Lactarius hatsudake]
MDDNDITSEEHAEIHMTKWWSAEEVYPVVRVLTPTLKRNRSMVQLTDTKRQEHNLLSLEDIEDIIFGATRKDGIWTSDSCAVPSGRIRSVYDHVQRAYLPSTDEGGMTGLTICTGRWSDEEGARLACIIKTMSAEGKTSTTSQKFWKEVAARMGNTMSPKQCRGKWNDSLNPRLQNQGRKPRSLLTSMFLFTTPLGLDFEVDIPWNILPDDGWKSWSGHRLQQKWAILKKTGWVEGATHPDIVQRLLALHGTLPNNSSVRENQPSTTENNS